MSVEVTARHLRTVGDIQEYAYRKGEAIIEQFPLVEHVHVILDVEKHGHIAEVVLQARRRVRIESAERSDNLRVSVDRAFAKAEKQIEKVREKVHDHKAAMKFAQSRRRGRARS
jgi:ribosomal subunit interface protein